jgi:UDP-N-acetylglucosamine--N-acetylmuramyl-(pentapeptide) pyrophosphoryl-undecaprenol N-acetylglucosamine transferase
MKQNYSLILTCGTRGHLMPALAIVENELENKKNIVLILDIKNKKKYENHINLLKEKHEKQLECFYNVPFTGIKSLIFPSFWISYFAMIKIIYKSSRVITFICGLQIHLMLLSILLKRKKTFLHEQDSVLNKTNRIGKIFGASIISSFRNVKYVKNHKWIGCPILLKKENEKEKNVKKKIITILAGTNGSDFFDEHIPAIFNKIQKEAGLLMEYKIYHNCKEKNLEKVKQFYEKEKLNVEVSFYFNNFESLIEQSEFLITRSGASTISYLALYEKNAIIIPWKNSSQQHQRKNAQQLYENNGIFLVNECENEFFNLENLILSLLKNREKHFLGQNIRNVFKIISGKKYIESIEN